jgi:CDGSH-type Zn-finger protein
MKLIPGKEYTYCACGLSNSQPFCDGSHEGTKFKPITFIAKNQTNSSICLCKHNDPEAGPYCDGNHADL